MKPKFEMGDRVIYKPQNYVGTICGVCSCTGIYTILCDDDRNKYSVLEEDIEFVNPKLTFLTRLQELLATFDAEIGVHHSSKIEAMPEGVMLTIYGVEPEERLFYSMPLVKDEDVFDYDED